MAHGHKNCPVASCRNRSNSPRELMTLEVCCSYQFHILLTAKYTLPVQLITLLCSQLKKKGRFVFLSREKREYGLFCFTDGIEKYGEVEVRVACYFFEKYRKFHRSLRTCEIDCFLFQKNIVFFLKFPNMRRHG